MDGITASKAEVMAREVPVLQPIELDCADEGLALEMARWLMHLRAERRLSPKTLEAYARDLRQCLTFLSQHWGSKVTLKLINNVPADPKEHGFAIPAYNIAETVVRGEPKTVEFTADKAGVFPITCHLHPAHVGGQLIVLE